MSDRHIGGPTSQTDARLPFRFRRPPLGSTYQIALCGLTVASFALYWLSSSILELRYATTHFGADQWSYAMLAQGNVWEQVGSEAHMGRLARFHPLTVAMAGLWMDILSPLAAWPSPAMLLKAMFAATGAAGVWAATSAFAVVMHRRHALLFGAIYATSLGIWYFASIEESKIVTASLSALYILIYLRLRDAWSLQRVLALTAVLAAACLNEIVSAFLVVVPAVDTALRRGWSWSDLRWIIPHGLPAPVALVVLEVVFNRRLAAGVPADDEGVSHIGMLLHYVTKNAHGLPELYAFLCNWLFFNLAAPTPHADYAGHAEFKYRGYFEPSLVNYVLTPLSVTLVALFAIVLAAILLPRFRDPRRSGLALAPLMAALAAYTLVRGLFFFIFNPPEPLLFSPAVTLAHLLIIGVPFADSRFPARDLVLAGIALFLLIINGSFIIGRPLPDDEVMRAVAMID